MAPIGSLHASVVSALSMSFARHVGELACVYTEDPLSLPPDSEPQPDLALLKPRSDRYRDAPPSAADVLLVIEVAHTTGEIDLEIKLPLYARHAIPEVWLIDLNSGIIEMVRKPTPESYRILLRPDRGESTTPALVASVHLPQSEFWPL